MKSDNSKIDWAGAEAGAKMFVGPNGVRTEPPLQLTVQIPCPDFPGAAAHRLGRESRHGCFDFRRRHPESEPGSTFQRSRSAKWAARFVNRICVWPTNRPS